MATACAATLDPVALVEAMSAKLVSNRQITDDAIENAKELCRWTLETLSPQRNSLWEGVWEIAVVAFAKASRVRSSGCTLESLNDMTLETIVPGSCQNLDVSVHQFDDRSKQVKAKELKLVHELLTCLLPGHQFVYLFFGQTNSSQKNWLNQFLVICTKTLIPVFGSQSAESQNFETMVTSTATVRGKQQLLYKGLRTHQGFKTLDLQKQVA